LESGAGLAIIFAGILVESVKAVLADQACTHLLVELPDADVRLAYVEVRTREPKGPESKVVGEDG
jgi:hypothetical protein